MLRETLLPVARAALSQPVIKLTELGATVKQLIIPAH
jgi:hypothetical protein